MLFQNKFVVNSLLGLISLNAFSADQTNDRPNILVILADDLGYKDLTVQGCEQFKTPAIDSIAQNGVLFTEGYVTNSVCAPSRAGLLSGRIDIGFEANLPDKGDHGLDPKVKTMAKSLQEAGYKTFCIGKWHLGESEKYHPNNRGFDEFMGLLSGSRSYFAMEKPSRNKVLELNGKPLPELKGSYMTDRLTDVAVDYLETHDRSKTNKPFFMYLSYTAPHGPLTSKPEYLNKFKHIKNEKRRNYAGMMQSLDEGVAKVLKCIDGSDNLKNTMVVFLSDNGGPKGQKDATDNGKLKAGKGSLYEGGVRVPFFIQWKGKVKPGQKINEMISTLDLFPTFTALAKAENPKGLSGVNLLPLLQGETKKLAKRSFKWRRGGKTQCAFRLGKYKWIASRRNGGQEALYDIEADPGERKNLIKTHPEIAQRLKKQFENWEAQVPDPSFASGWKPKKNSKSK